MKRNWKFILLSVLFIISSLFLVACGEHTHTFSSNWSYDEIYHWHEATCEHVEEKSEYAEHIWDAGEITKQPSKDEEGEKTFTCVVCKKQKKEPVSKISKDELIFKTLQFTFNTEHNYYETSIVLRNGVETFDFEDEITCSGVAGYTLMKENEKSEIVGVSGYAADLQYHDMVFYVVGVKLDGGNKTYRINFHVNNLYEVKFLDKEGNAFSSQSIEEGYTVGVPESSPTAQGYDFIKWDFDFETTILKDTEISSVFTPRNDTPYKVEFYHKGSSLVYTKINTWNLVGTSDTEVTVDIDKYIKDEGLDGVFHLNTEKTQTKGIISAKGDTVLEVYFDINEFEIINKNPEFGEMSVEGTEETKFFFGTQITLKITYYKACHFDGLISKGGISYHTPLKEDPDPTVIKFVIQDTLYLSLKKDDDLKDFSTKHTKNSVKVIGYNGAGGDVVVPESVNEVGTNALGSNNIIKSLEFKYNSVIFKDSAIQKATALESVILPKTVYKLPYYLFSGCTALKSVTIPNSVEELDGSVFSGCTALEHINFGSGIKKVTGDFSSYDGLKEFILPNSCTSVGPIFKNLKSVERIVMPNTLDNEYRNAYVHNCPKLKSIVFPKNMEKFRGDMLSNCESLEYIVLGNKITQCGLKCISEDMKKIDVFYEGTAEQLVAIQDVGYLYSHFDLEGNPITNSVYFYSEKEKAGDWHYVDGVPTIWESKEP